MKIIMPCLFAAATVSCGNIAGNYSCPASLVPAVVVEVRDAQTGAPRAEGARGAVQDGAYVDSLKPFEVSLSLQGAFERPGTYAVEVHRAGYQTWTVSGVRVSKQRCGVATVRLLANLVSAP